MTYHLLYFAVVAFIATSVAFRGTVYVNKGEQFTVPCKNHTPGSYFGIIWKDKDEIYAQLPTTGLKIHRRIFTRSRLVNETSLQIDDATLDDAGVYECNLIYIPMEINFPHVVVPSLITVIVFVRPIITSISPARQYRSLGGKAVIECEFGGIPFANVSWKFEAGNGVIYRYTKFSNSSVLKLGKLRRRDTGYYTCVAYNRAGQVEKRAYVKVMYPPRITYITPNPRIDLEETGTITCKAKGYPLPAMYWYLQKEDSEISLSSGHWHFHKYSVSDTKTNKVKEWAQSELTIRSVQAGDLEFNYTCIAANDEGSIDKDFHIVGFAKPDPPALYVTKITSNSVLLRWSIPSDGGSKLIAFVVQYKITLEKKWKLREIGPANVQYFQLMGLIPNTQYTFRVSARNSVGLSDFSGAIRLYTAKEDQKKESISSRTAGPYTKASKPVKEKKGILGDLGLAAIIGIVGGVFLIMLVIFVITYCSLRKGQESVNLQQRSVFGSSRPVSSENGSLMLSEGRRPSRLPSDTTEFIPLMPRADHWEFPRGRLRLSTVLGSGAFGMVKRGDAEGIRGSSGSVKVAVKIVKDDDNEFARKDLHAELDMLKLLPEHPNVVSLLGCCTRSEPLMIIVEYCAHGDLQGFLRSSRGVSESYYKSTYHPIGQKMTSKMLLTFAFQIAKGMSHLAAFKVIHRDLAARNILVDEDLVCKISDFGFARDIYVEDQYMKTSKGGRFPIKWMALESLLDGISTSKSDVWSFGVVLWEIITLGASPYPGLNSYELVSFLQDGYRMDNPKHCSDELYALCMKCWHVRPQRRPSFADLSDTLTEMLNDTKEYINMDFYQNHLYENFDVNLGCQTSVNGGSVESPPSETAPLTVVLEETASAASS